MKLIIFHWDHREQSSVMVFRALVSAGEQGPEQALGDPRAPATAVVFYFTA